MGKIIFIEHDDTEHVTESGVGSKPASYTHLTLPTNSEVLSTVVAGG